MSTVHIVGRSSSHFTRVTLVFAQYFRRIGIPSPGNPSQSLRNVLFAARVA